MRVSQEEVQAVKKAMDSEKQTRLYKRYRALYLCLCGKTYEEVVEMVGLCKTSVYRINKVYKKEGLAGIPDKPRKGRPPKLTAEQKANIKEMILKKTPFEVGFPAEFNWIAELVAKYVKQEYGLDYTIRGIAGILKRLGLSYARPTYVLAKNNRQKQERFIKDFRKVKKLAGQ